MNCMKCGREIPLGQVFCKDCLADMENYPVKPDTPVYLPVREPATQSRRSSNGHKAKKPEEQVARLRKWVAALGLMLLTVSLAFAITVSVLLHRIVDNQEDTLPGQNYSTMDATFPTE